jgi:hypothetical protein
VLRIVIDVIFPLSNFQESIRACRISFFVLAWDTRESASGTVCKPNVLRMPSSRVMHP